MSYVKIPWILNRYLARMIITITLIMLLLIIGLEIFVELISQMSDIGHGDYTIWQALFWVLLNLPQVSYQLFPVAGLLGCIVSLGILASRSELVVMRASGMSLIQIISAVLLISILQIAVMTIIGEWWAPAASQLAASRKTMLLAGGQALQTAHGVWIREDNNFIHINKVIGSQQIIGVTRYQFNQQHQLQKASFAESGVYHQHAWHMQQVAATIFGTIPLQVQHLSQATWHLRINPNLLNLSRDNPQRMSLKKLLQFIRYRNKNGLQDMGDEVVLWQRLLQPVAALVMILLGIPCVFGSLRTTPMVTRIVVGVLLGFGFYVINQFLGPISSVYQLSPFWVASTPILLFGLLAGYLLWRVR